MRKALITGANKSIGLEAARYLAQNGYHVIIGSRNLDRGNEAVQILKAEGLDHAEALQLDVADAASVERAATDLAARHSSLDALINNAGIPGAFPQTASQTPMTVLREVYDTNFFGLIQVTQAFLPLLKNSDAPRIVNVTSGLGSLTLHNDPAWGYYDVKSAAYGTSKTAVNAYTVVLAYEFRDSSFKINTVDPGYTRTDFNHHSGPLDPRDSGAFIAQYAMLPEDGPTGKFFSHDISTGDHQSPW